MGRISIIGMAIVAVLSVSLGLAITAMANSVASSTMHFEGSLTDAGGGVYTGTIPATAGEYYVPGGPGEAIWNQGGFDVYAKAGACAYVQGFYGTGAWNCAGPDTAVVPSNHDAYAQGGPWGAWYDPDVADWVYYALELTADHWYLRYTPTNESPMSGLMTWNGDGTGYAYETDLGTQLGGHGGSAAHGGGPQAWDVDWGWGVEVVPLELPGFGVVVTPLGGGTYKVTLPPASAPPGKPSVGGMVELLADSSHLPASAADSSGSSVPYAAIAGGVAAAAVVALAAGGWSARRRWLR